MLLVDAQLLLGFEMRSKQGGKTTVLAPLKATDIIEKLFFEPLYHIKKGVKKYFQFETLVGLPQIESGLLMAWV